MDGSTDRPRGILTPHDRALLRGEIEYDVRQRYSNRYNDIRERIANGLLDFNLIRAYLRDRDRKRIFIDPAHEAGVPNAPFIESLRELLYWTYFGLKEQNYDFEGLLADAIEQAEKDFALTYWGKNVEVGVQFDIDVTQSSDITDLITTIENGGPVTADRLYNLLESPTGVPIDTSKLDTLQVRFRSSYPSGEKAVIDSLFSDYLGVEIEIEDATTRLTPEDLGLERRNAAVDPDQSQPTPSEIKNYRSPIDFSNETDEETVEEIRQQEQLDQPFDEKTNLSSDTELVGDVVMDEVMEKARSRLPTVYEITEERKKAEDRTKAVTPEEIIELLDRVQEQFVSTIEIGAALGCAPEAARQILKELLDQQRVRTRSITDTSGSQLRIWWLIDE